jgi:hypothetical protein
MNGSGLDTDQVARRWLGDDATTRPGLDANLPEIR